METIIQAIPKLTKLTIDLDALQNIKLLPEQIKQVATVVVCGPREGKVRGEYTVRTLNQAQLEDLFAVAEQKP